MTELTPIIYAVGIGVIGFVVGNNRQESKARSRIYERMDEELTKFEQRHVNKDVCEITHKNLERDVTEIKCDVKKLLQKNGLK